MGIAGEEDGNGIETCGGGLVDRIGKASSNVSLGSSSGVRTIGTVVIVV